MQRLTYVSKTLRAVRETGCGRVVLGGGVSANVHLRQEMERRIQELDAETDPRSVHHASLRLSLDNGAMIARAARFRFERESVPRWIRMHGRL